MASMQSVTWCVVQCWHKAMEEGMMAVERIHGEKVQVNYDTIISVDLHTPRNCMGI